MILIHLQNNLVTVVQKITTVPINPKGVATFSSKSTGTCGTGPGSNVSEC
jgi:hypothetical protein